MDYITIDEIKTYTGETYTPEQEQALTDIATGLESQMEAYCNRSFKAQTWTEYFDGGANTFLVKNPPISEITSVKVDDELIDEDEVFNYGGYVKLETPAGSGFQNVEIVYVTAGGLPEALKNALIQWVISQYAQTGAGGNQTGMSGSDVKNISVGPVSVNYGASSETIGSGTQTSSSSGLLSGVPEVVADVLKLYRKNPL